MAKVTREIKIQHLIELMLYDPEFFTPVHLWLQLINKMDNHELDLIVVIYCMEDEDYTEQQRLALHSIVKRHMPELNISELFPETEEEEEDEFFYIGLN